MGFFSGVAAEEIKGITHRKDSTLNFTVTALRISKIANGVSEIHRSVANDMWGGNEGICKIISITNAQSKKFWMDEILEDCLNRNDDDGLIKRKSELKAEPLETVADQTGKLLDPNILTIVWARPAHALQKSRSHIKGFRKICKAHNTGRGSHPDYMGRENLS